MYLGPSTRGTLRLTVFVKHRVSIPSDRRTNATALSISTCSSCSECDTGSARR